MKRLSVIGVVLAMLALFTAVVAAGGPLGDPWWLNRDPINGPQYDDSSTIDVAAYIYDYVELRAIEFSGSNDLGNKSLEMENFLGNEGDMTEELYDSSHHRDRSAGFQFQIASNCTVDLTAEITQPLHQGEEYLETRVDIWKFSDEETTGGWPWDHRGQVVATDVPNSVTIAGIQPRDLHDYLFRVTGNIGDVHVQPSGDYEGQVVLTVSVAD